MVHKQDKNAFAYVIYERAAAPFVKEGFEITWVRTRMFYAVEEHFDRDEVWDREVTRRDPESIRVRPLYDEDGNDARRDEHLDDVNARYRRSTDRVTLQDAVEDVLDGDVPIELDEFEGLIKTLEAFDSTLMHQLTIPAHMVNRADHLPSFEEERRALLEDIQSGINTIPW